MKPIRPYRLSDFQVDSEGMPRGGFLMPTLEWAFANLYILDGALLLGWRDPVRHATYVDCVVVGAFLMGALGYWIGLPLVLLYVLPRLAVVMVQCTVNGMLPSVKRRVRSRIYSFYGRPVSTERSLVLGFLCYLELILLFGVIYRTFPETIRKGHGPLGMEPLYFSAITQLTIGYGDLAPVGVGRPLAIGQTFFGLFIVVTQVARYVGVIATLPDADDDEKQDPNDPEAMSGAMVSKREG